MKKYLFIACMAVAIAAANVAVAVPPAYCGPMGNPEEPAMRPYKWLFHGVKTLVHHPIARFNQGNSVIPPLGTLETFRGVREGVFDLAESTYNGLIFSIPPEDAAYRQTGRINHFIDQDPLLSTVADAPTLPIKIVNRHPAAIRERMELVEKHAQQVREARRQARAQRKAAVPEEPPAPRRTPTEVWFLPMQEIHIVEKSPL